MDPQFLSLDEVLALLLPRPYGYPPNRELFSSATAPSFDALGAAEVVPARIEEGTLTGEPMPNFVAALRRSRRSHRVP